MFGEMPKPIFTNREAFGDLNSVERCNRWPANSFTVSPWTLEEKVSASITFKNLRQQGSVESYWHQFQDCLDNVGDLPEEFVLNCFVEGLKEELQDYIQSRRPRSLQDYKLEFVEGLRGRQLELLEILLKAGACQAAWEAALQF